MHAFYDTMNTDHDIALIEMDRPVKFTKAIRPVCLAEEKASFVGEHDNFSRPHLADKVDKVNATSHFVHLESATLCVDFRNITMTSKTNDPHSERLKFKLGHG